MANLAEHHSRSKQAQAQAQTQTQAQTGLDHQSFEPTGSIELANRIPKILPHERVFPIQIGTELFKLSGASISSDGVFSHSTGHPMAAIRSLLLPIYTHQTQ